MYSFTVFQGAKENKKCHKSPSQADVQLWCWQAKEQKSKEGSCTSKYLLRCCVSWALLPHSAAWESQNGGRMAGQPQPPLTCNGIPCSALGQGTAQPCRGTAWKGTMHLRFPHGADALSAPHKQDKAEGTYSGRLQEVRIQISPTPQGSLTMQVPSPFLLAEYNLLRFTLK